MPINALSAGSLYTRYLAVWGALPLPPSRQFLTCASCTSAVPRSSRETLHTGHLSAKHEHRIIIAEADTHSARSLSCELDCPRVGLGIESLLWSMNIRSIEFVRDVASPVGTVAVTSS